MKDRSALFLVYTLSFVWLLMGFEFQASSRGHSPAFVLLCCWVHLTTWSAVPCCLERQSARLPDVKIGLSSFKAIFYFKIFNLECPRSENMKEVDIRQDVLIKCFHFYYNRKVFPLLRLVKYQLTVTLVTIASSGISQIWKNLHLYTALLFIF